MKPFVFFEGFTELIADRSPGTCQEYLIFSVSGPGMVVKLNYSVQRLLMVATL